MQLSDFLSLSESKIIQIDNSKKINLKQKSGIGTKRKYSTKLCLLFNLKVFFYFLTFLRYQTGQEKNVPTFYGQIMFYLHLKLVNLFYERNNEKEFCNLYNILLLSHTESFVFIYF